MQVGTMLSMPGDPVATVPILLDDDVDRCHKQIVMVLSR